MKILSSPPGLTDNLADYPFASHFDAVLDGEGGSLRMHQVDEGPRGARAVVSVHGNPSWSVKQLPDANPAWRDNWTHGAATLHMEIMHLASRTVWLSQQAVSDATFDALVSPEGFVKTGIGESVADVAYFRRSPGSDRDGPVETMDVGGVRLAQVARAAGAPEPALDGVRVLPVEKHHLLLFQAGRTLEIMDFGDGFDYVPLVTRARGAITGKGRPSGTPRARVLPSGWSVRAVTLARDLVVELPNPTRVAFFANGDSFQGPLRLAL